MNIRRAGLVSGATRRLLHSLAVTRPGNPVCRTIASRPARFNSSSSLSDEDLVPDARARTVLLCTKSKLLYFAQQLIR